MAKLPILEATEIKKDSDELTILTSLQELINSHVQTMQRLNEEKTKLSEMVQDGYKNDVQYKEAEDKLKDLQKQLKAVKQQIMSRPGVIEVVNKLKSVRAEIKERKMSLSDYLLEYQRMTGATQLELFDNEIYEIVQTAKVIKKVTKNG